MAPGPKRGWAGALYGLAGLYLTGSLFVFVGFALHRSSVEVIGPYTPGYLAFLILIGSALLAPFFFGVGLTRALGARRTLKLFGAFGLVLLTFYALAETLHATFREHSFDPFLQFPGTRFDDLPQEKGPEINRIVTIGGSTTHNPFLPLDQRYPSVLQEELNGMESNTRWEVLNAGMDWWTTKHSHINYATYIRSWKPDLAIVMHAINDLYRSFSPPQYSLGSYDSQWAHFYGPAIRGAKPRNLIGYMLSSWTAGTMAHRWYGGLRYREVDYDQSQYLSLPNFEEQLKLLVQTLRNDGVEVLLLTQPSLYRDDLGHRELGNLWFPKTFCVTHDGWWFREIPSVRSMAMAMDAYNDVVRSVGESEGVYVLDLASLIPKSLDYFGDDVHYTELGASTVGKEVARYLWSLEGFRME